MCSRLLFRSHHADYRPRATADRDLLSDDVGVPAETPLPEIVSENDNRIFFGSIFLDGKSAAQDRRNTQHFKQPVRDTCAANLARRSTGGHRKTAGPAVRGNAFEGID